jgi:hypothetical protein
LKLASSAAAVAALLALPSLASADEVFKQTRTITIPGSPLVSFDISWVDPVLGKYFLGDRSNKAVDVIDTDTKNVKQFTPGFVGFTGNNDTSGPDGVITVDHKELWVGDGQSRVWVLNPHSGTPIHVPKDATNPILTSPANPKRADELCYDPDDHLVMVANNADAPPFASIISTETYQVVAHIPFDGKNGAPESNNGAEQCGYSPRTGMFYISIPGIAGLTAGAGGVAVINPHLKKVVNTFLIDPTECAAPQGLAIGPAPQILLGCNGDNPTGVFNTVIINEENGTTIKTFANLGGNDEVWFNEGDGHYFLAGGSHLPNEQLGIVDSTVESGPVLDQIIATGTPGGTMRRAHSVAADPIRNEVYLPIPATGGSGFQSMLCGAAADEGCIAIFATTNNDDPIVVRERGPDNKQE